MKPVPTPSEPRGTAAPHVEDDGFEHVVEELRLLEKLNQQQVRGTSILDTLYGHCMEAVEARLPALSKMYLPISRRQRRIVLNMQESLSILADFLAGDINDLPPLSLWRILRLLSRHLFISSLTASPPGAGIWRRLHQAYALADRQGIAQAVPKGAARSPRDEYLAAILLGCSQPSSFTSREIFFLEAYVERFVQEVDVGVQPDSPVAFWIDLDSDATATSYARKLPAPGTPVRNFSCRTLASLLESQLAALESGTPPEELDLPPFAATAAGFGVLTRLVHSWGNPGKRRFPRRSQNYRGELCLGFDNLCRLYGTHQPIDSSTWMITNKSPDGFAVMHLSGETHAIKVGDIAALRTENEDDWQLCIIRWALSESREHIELGLQILSSSAYLADIALPTTERRTALVLPAGSMLRQNETLVVPTGALAGHPGKLVLVVEHDKIEIREIGFVHCDERNGLVELYEIVPQRGDQSRGDQRAGHRLSPA
ncbi:MAG: hypothetical protein LBE85_13860 [Candidatus Accumulibacter sp.]|nr:hypothetical protein [Accumulibacter sp.]